MINLLRIDPIHCCNTILEIMRNRYDQYDQSYSEIIKSVQTPLDMEPYVMETEEGVEALDDLIKQLVTLHVTFQENIDPKKGIHVLQPLRWEHSLNFVVDEEDIFELLKKEEDFLEYLN